MANTLATRYRKRLHERAAEQVWKGLGRRDRDALREAARTLWAPPRLSGPERRLFNDGLIRDNGMLSAEGAIVYEHCGRRTFRCTIRIGGDEQTYEVTE